MIVEKTWGNEKILVNNNDYCAKYLRGTGGFVTSLHRHLIKRETFVPTEGEAVLMFHDGDGVMRQAFKMSPATLAVVTIEPKIWHRVFFLNDATLLEVSTTHRDCDVQRLSESGQFTGNQMAMLRALDFEVDIHKRLTILRENDASLSIFDVR